MWVSSVITLRHELMKIQMKLATFFLKEPFGHVQFFVHPAVHLL